MLLFGQKCETFAADLIGLVVVGMEYMYICICRYIYFEKRKYIFELVGLLRYKIA